MEEEEWVTHPEYKQMRVSSLWNIEINWKPKKFYVKNNKYYLKFTHNWLRLDIAVHNLVALCFLWPPKKWQRCYHFWPRTLINEPDYLMYETPAENKKRNHRYSITKYTPDGNSTYTPYNSVKEIKEDTWYTVRQITHAINNQAPLGWYYYVRD